MSTLVQSNSYFLRLLYETTRRQAHVLLQNTTTSQTQLLQEISHNLLDISLMTRDQEKEVKRHNSLLKRLAKKKTSIKTKQKIIKENYKELYNLLKSVEEPLLEVI